MKIDPQWWSLEDWMVFWMWMTWLFLWCLFGSRNSMVVCEESPPIHWYPHQSSMEIWKGRRRGDQPFLGQNSTLLHLSTDWIPHVIHSEHHLNISNGCKTQSFCPFRAIFQSRFPHGQFCAELLHARHHRIEPSETFTLWKHLETMANFYPTKLTTTFETEVS
jgi:hypothetical protein